jgi:hypothetical protein
MKDDTTMCDCTADFCSHHAAGKPCPNEAIDPVRGQHHGSGAEPLGPQFALGFCEECWENHQQRNPEQFRG